jgi:heme-degrading monooxygenase HmoA
MIARKWHGRVAAEHEKAYRQVVIDTGIRDIRRAPGNAAAHLLRNTEDGVTHFTLITLWQSWDAIRNFAGDDPERAVYYPEDDPYLLEKEPTVVHYHVDSWHGALAASAENDDAAQVGTGEVLP